MSNNYMRQALDALLNLESHERRAVLCWFCDACAEYVGPGETHRCTMGSTVYPPAIIPSKSSKPKEKLPFWLRAQSNGNEPPIDGQCNHIHPSNKRCGCPKWHMDYLYCWHHSSK